MKKRISGRKLSRTTNERKQLFRNLLRSVVIDGFIEITLVKAKAVRPQVEKLVTLAKKGDLTAFRRLLSAVDDAATAKQYLAYGKIFATRSGGYTRIIRLGSRAGDNIERARLEFVQKMEKQPMKVDKVEKVDKTEAKAEVKKETKAKIKTAKTKKTPKAK